jgi:putative restriction endonuclease
VQPKLTELLAEFGPPRQRAHPEHPFWRLQNDGIWVVPEADAIRRTLTASGDAPHRVLLERAAHGGLPEGLFEILASRPELVNRLAHEILDTNFPHSLHAEILDACGFPWVQQGARRRRDPEFRGMILRIYEHRCAMCGYDGRLGSADLGIEAAHVKWHAAGGPDEAANGLALCTIHHLCLDRGAISLSDEHSILVSQHVHGTEQVSERLVHLAGRRMRLPQAGEPPPAARFLAWHRREVFREPAR